MHVHHAVPESAPESPVTISVVLKVEGGKYFGNAIRQIKIFHKKDTTNLELGFPILNNFGLVHFFLSFIKITENFLYLCIYAFKLNI